MNAPKYTTDGQFKILQDNEIDEYIDTLIGTSSKPMNISADSSKFTQNDTILMVESTDSGSYLKIQKDNLNELFNKLLELLNIKEDKISETNDLTKYLIDLKNSKETQLNIFFTNRTKRLERIKNFKPCKQQNKVKTFEEFIKTSLDPEKTLGEETLKSCPSGIFNNEPYKLQSKKIYEFLNSYNDKVRLSNVRVGTQDMEKTQFKAWKNMYYRLYLIDGILFEIEQFIKKYRTEFANIFVDILKPIKNTTLAEKNITKTIGKETLTYRFTEDDKTMLSNISLDEIYNILTRFFTAMENNDTTLIEKIIQDITKTSNGQHGGGPFSFLKKVVDIFYCGVKFFAIRILKLIIGTIGVAIGSIIGAFYITGLYLLMVGGYEIAAFAALDITGTSLALMITSFTVVLLDQTVLRVFTENKVAPIFTYLIFYMIGGSVKYAFTGGGGDDDLENSLFNILSVYLFSEDITILLNNPAFQSLFTNDNIDTSKLSTITPLITNISINLTKFEANLEKLLEFLADKNEKLYDKFLKLKVDRSQQTSTKTLFEEIKEKSKETIQLLKAIANILIYIPGLKNKIIIMNYCLLHPQKVDMIILFIKNVYNISELKTIGIPEGTDATNVPNLINKLISSVPKLSSDQIELLLKDLNSKKGGTKKNYIIIKKTKVKRRIYYDSNKKKYIKLKSKIVYLHNIRGKYLNVK